MKKVKPRVKKESRFFMQKNWNFLLEYKRDSHFLCKQKKSLYLGVEKIPVVFVKKRVSFVSTHRTTLSARKRRNFLESKLDFNFFRKKIAALMQISQALSKKEREI